MAYARRFFAMHSRAGDGATMRAHLEAAAKMGSVSAKAELAKDLSPGPLAYVWRWFLELHARRGMGAMGPAPITWPDFDAWARRKRIDPEPWEFDLLGVLDNEFFATKEGA